MDSKTYLDTDEVFLSTCVFAAFFVNGMQATEYECTLSMYGRGHKDLVEEVAQHALYLAKIEHAITENLDIQLHRSGGFEHQVCRQFGEWFAAHIRATRAIPDLRTCRNYLANVVVAYFSPNADLRRAWDVMHAIRNADRNVLFESRYTAQCVNWEWLVAGFGHDSCGQRVDHPVHTRAHWSAEVQQLGTGQNYWTWVDCKLGMEILIHRYRLLAEKPNIFLQLLSATAFEYNGTRLSKLVLLRKIIAQEFLAQLERGTRVSAGLLSCRPEMLAAFSTLGATFDPQLWYGIEVVEFLSEHERWVDPDSEVCWAELADVHGQKGLSLTLQALWDAHWRDGAWILRTGHRLVLARGAAWQEEVPAMATDPETCTA
ncbi:hypothetical protein GJ700_02330 [Duganella sp. FT92W]|uniref:Uncharacterized protein n=1 Tax=Pseudoduganella rivuli TaxID=2666085 RepID=A0A7X2IIQ7_9BURK|nr:hypothetical protein [Pseudoduganella rivuli]MRV70555.1 hypothetical protein [Pseudoduganella rivuli]